MDTVRGFANRITEKARAREDKRRIQEQNKQHDS